MSNEKVDIKSEEDTYLYTLRKLKSKNFVANYHYNLTLTLYFSFLNSTCTKETLINTYIHTYKHYYIGSSYLGPNICQEMEKVSHLGCIFRLCLY